MCVWKRIHVVAVVLGALAIALRRLLGNRAVLLARHDTLRLGRLAREQQLPRIDQRTSPDISYHEEHKEHKVLFR